MISEFKQNSKTELEEAIEEANRGEGANTYDSIEDFKKAIKKIANENSNNYKI